MTGFVNMNPASGGGGARPGPRAARARWGIAALAILGIVVILNAGAFAVRLWFVATSGPYAATTGFEEFCLYNIWKAAHGFPVYEWPHRDHYLLSFYNVGFYYASAGWVKLWRLDGPAIVAGARLFTVPFAVLGMVMQARLLHRLAPDGGRGATMLRWSLSFIVWFGTSFMAWTPVSARPDIPAVALALSGFALVLRTQESPRLRNWVVSSLFFFAGWLFKQSVVWILAGTVLHLLWSRRDWRVVVGLTVPFGLLATAVLAGGSEPYRYNLLRVPHIFQWLPLQSVRLLAQAIALNLFFFGSAARGWRKDGGLSAAVVPSGDAAMEKRWSAVGWAAATALMMGTVQLALRGSATNNVMEGLVMVSLLGGASWLRALHRGTSWAPVVGALCLATMIPLPAVQLLRAAEGVTYTAIGGVSIGNLTKLNAGQLERRKHYAGWLETVPRPFWIRDAMLQLPWFATEGQYPAFVLNEQFESDAAAKGVLVGAGFAEWIPRRHFRALLLRADDPLAAVARRAGYVETAAPGGGESLPNEFGFDGPAPRLFLLPPAPERSHAGAVSRD